MRVSLIVWEQSELIVELENRFGIRVPVSEFGRDDWNTANKIVEGVTELPECLSVCG